MLLTTRSETAEGLRPPRVPFYACVRRNNIMIHLQNISVENRGALLGSQVNKAETDLTPSDSTVTDRTKTCGRVTVSAFTSSICNFMFFFCCMVYMAYPVKPQHSRTGYHIYGGLYGKRSTCLCDPPLGSAPDPARAARQKE